MNPASPVRGPEGRAFLESERDALQDIIDLKKSSVLISNQSITHQAGDSSYWDFAIQYAGYIEVTIEASTSTDNFVKVVYMSNGVNYDAAIPINIVGKAVFPVLPSIVRIYIGNLGLSNATYVVSVIYYY